MSIIVCGECHSPNIQQATAGLFLCQECGLVVDVPAENLPYCSPCQTKLMHRSPVEIQMMSFFAQLKAEFNVNISFHTCSQIFDQFYPKLLQQGKFQSIPLIAAVIFYRVCQENNNPIDLDALLTYMSLSGMDFCEFMSVIVP